MKKKKYTLQKKMTKTFAIVFICILLFATLAISVISVRTYGQKSYELCEQLVSLNLNLLDNQIMDIQKVQETVAKNAQVKETVEYFHQQTKKDYGTELLYWRKMEEVFNMLAKNKEISGAYMIDKSGKFIYAHKKSPKMEYDMLTESWYSDLVETISMDNCFVSGLHDQKYLVNETEEQCVSMVMPIQIREKYRFAADAYLVFDISVSAILDDSGKNDMQFAILDGTGELYFDTGRGLGDEMEKSVVEAIKKADTYTEVMNKNLMDNSIVVAMKSQIFGWKIIGVKQLYEIRDLNITLAIIMIAVIGVAVLLIMYLSGKVSMSVLTPIDQLINECNRVSAGDYSVEFEEKESEEVSFLSETIEHMVGNIVKLSNQVVEEEKQLSEEKLRALQHQINPHFLNNTLQTIKALAVTGETDKISRLSTLLGHILAYSVYEPYQNVELKTELNYVENYIELQNIRYDKNIFYSIDCEKEVEDVQIPKLTLQPLVENAIEHGYKGKTMIINVSAEAEEDTACVIINDNGKGIAEHDLKELKRRLEAGEVYRQTASVGIVNVNERLKKIYGKEYGIGIISKEGKGTTVVMRIPKKRGN